jgi:FAD/FMN-containing dehydrogenase
MIIWEGEEFPLPSGAIITDLMVHRSSAPNSLSIWTHNMKGLTFHNGFSPKGCSFSIDTPAVTAAAGTQMLEIDEQAQLINLTIVGGGAATVGVGGYLTGGGYSALSATFGMAADQVLEIEMVTPGGDVVTVNECQNTDLFWAMRGVSPCLSVRELANKRPGWWINIWRTHIGNFESLPFFRICNYCHHWN